MLKHAYVEIGATNEKGLFYVHVVPRQFGQTIVKQLFVLFLFFKDSILTNVMFYYISYFVYMNSCLSIINSWKSK